jgi:type IV pilus assembly protein PilE
MKKQLVARQRQRGFTLIELMMVVAIIGILASIGYPSYINSVIKSNRAAAQSHLMDLAQAQQKYFNDARAFGAKDDMNITEPDRVSASYTIAVVPVVGPPPTFSITATPRAGSRQVGDGILLIDNTGTKTRGGEAW